MLDFNGSIPCPRWCSHLYCATDYLPQERWHRSRVWSVPIHLTSPDPSSGHVPMSHIYLSQGAREVEPTINLDLDDKPLVLLRPTEGRQIFEQLRYLIDLLDGDP